jgi:hypothetical protein
MRNNTVATGVSFLPQYSEILPYNPMQATPLPSLNETGIANLDGRRAYDLVLNAGQAGEPQRATDGVMHARIVGWLLTAFHDHTCVLGNRPFACITRKSVQARNTLSLPFVHSDFDTERDCCVHVRFTSYRIGAFSWFKRTHITRKVDDEYSYPPPLEYPSHFSSTTVKDMVNDALSGSGKDCPSVRKHARLHARSHCF